MFVLIFSTNLSEPFLILRTTERDRSKSYIGLRVKTRQSCQILMKHEFSRQIFKKYSNIKFHENPSSGAELFHAGGQTDGHDEANSRSSSFCEGA
jgi:hypothetical protein